MSFKPLAIITGAGGLVGQAVCKTFYLNDLDFMAVYHNPPQKKVNWRYIVLDLENDLSLLEPYWPDYVIHCAANVPKSIAYDHLMAVALKNKKIDAGIIDFLKSKSSQLIYASGTSVYGFDTVDIINEEYPTHSIQNPYFKQKIESENLFFKELNNVTVFRISAPYNETMEANTVIKQFIVKAKNNENILYHGTGARQQDFIHTDDISNAILSCLKRNNKSNAIFNIATGNAISMKQLAEKIVSKIPGCKSKIIPSGITDPQENFKAHYDIGKAERELNWIPKVTIDAGIEAWINKEGLL